MIPLNITPVSAPTATNSNAMGSLADMIAEIAFRNKKLAEDARQADMSNATNLEAVRGKNDYFGMEKDTHRMLAEDRATARTEKGEAKQKQRLDFLQDAYRKAKTPAERQMILDQLRGHAASMNNSLEELPAEDTATDVAPTAEAPAGGKPGFTPFQAGKKAPAVNKGFAGALGAYMQTPEATASPAEGAEGAQPGGVNVSPFPWDALGLPKPEGNAMAAPPKGSGRFALKDKEGNLLQTFDTNSEGDSVRASIMAAAKERPGDTPDEKHASEMAMQRATSLYPQVGAAKAADIYDQTYKAVMSEVKKRGVAGAGGSGAGAGGPSKAEMKLEGMDREEFHKIVNDFKGNYDVPATIKAERMAQSAVADLDRGGGMNSLNALKQYMLQMSGKVVTDREMDQFLSSTGKWNNFEMKMNQWTKAGEMPPEFKAALREMLGNFAMNASKRRLEMAQNAKESARLGGMDDSGQARVYGFFTGDYGGAPEKGALRDRGKKAPAGSSGSGGTGGNKKAELKALLEAGD